MAFAAAVGNVGQECVRTLGDVVTHGGDVGANLAMR
jgi:hypothetical protein